MNRRVTLQNKSSRTVGFADITEVAQALQTQVDRDFSPIWGVRAQIFPLHDSDPVPTGAWPISIVNKPVGGLGIHLDKNHKPFAQVKDTPDWSVTASHELLEMLADPYGKRFTQAHDIDPDSDKHLVSYLVEVGDPCEVYTYNIGNVAVSDFVTVEYYNDHPADNATFDFLTRLDGPLEVPEGCYISWEDPDDQRWHQKTPDGSFKTGRAKINSKNNPRDERDKQFGDDEEERRHDLPRLLKEYMQRESNCF